METSSGSNEWNVSASVIFRRYHLLQAACRSTWTSEATTPVTSVGFQSEGGVGGYRSVLVLLSTQAAASVVNKEERRLPVVSFLLPQPQTGAVSHLITLSLISPDVCWKIVRPTKKGGGKKRNNSSVTLHGANNKEVERRLESAGIRGEEE